MHVLHVESGRNLYGGALQVLYLLEGLQSQGCRNTLVCTAGSQIGRAAAGNGTGIHEVPMAGDLDSGFVFRLRGILRSKRPDLVHVHSRRGADLWSAFAARTTQTRAVLTRRVDNPEAAWFARAKYGLYDRTIVISDAIRRILLAHGVPAERIVCIPSAVESRPPGKNGYPDEEFRREFGLMPGEKAVGVIAQLIPRKGHRHVIDAAPGVLRHYPNTRFLFFGQGPLQSRLQRRCRMRGIADRVQFVGFRTDLPEILPRLDLVVHPAEMEGLGVSLLQAAAAGVPIVATRVGGIPEIVRDGVNGYLVAAGHTEAMSRATVSLLRDPLKARRFGEAGREIVHANFSIASMVEGNLRVYREVLEEGADQS
jgi:glycosyltransferase involved in cell wall biosynthesis